MQKCSQESPIKATINTTCLLNLTKVVISHSVYLVPSCSGVAPPAVVLLLLQCGVAPPAVDAQCVGSPGGAAAEMAWFSAGPNRSPKTLQRTSSSPNFETVIQRWPRPYLEFNMPSVWYSYAVSQSWLDLKPCFGQCSQNYGIFIWPWKSVGGLKGAAEWRG